MRQWRVGTLTLGLMLIILGSAFFIARTSGAVTIAQVLSWWPLVIILLGVELLLSGVIVKGEDSKIRFDGFSIFAIILIILYCTGAFTVTKIGKHINFSNIPFSINDYKYTDSFKKNASINVNGKNSLIVENKLGTIDVGKSSSGNIELEAEIKLNTNDEAYAKSIYNSLVEVSDSNPVKITTNLNGLDRDRANIKTINLVIKVPENIALDLKNEFGKIIVDSIAGKTTIYDKNGSISVKNVTGVLEVTNEFGSITVDSIKGDSKVINKNGSINISNIDGSLYTENKFGSITVKGIKNNLEANGENGRVSMQDIGGDVISRNKFGTIELKNAVGTVKLSNNNGSINFENSQVITKNITMDSKFGSVTLRVPREQQGNFKLHTKLGGIKNNFNLPVKKTNTESDVNSSIGDSGVEFNINNENGSININSR